MIKCVWLLSLQELERSFEYKNSQLSRFSKIFIYLCLKGYNGDLCRFIFHHFPFFYIQNVYGSVISTSESIRRVETQNRFREWGVYGDGIFQCGEWSGGLQGIFWYLNRSFVFVFKFLIAYRKSSCPNSL